MYNYYTLTASRDKQFALAMKEKLECHNLTRQGLERYELVDTQITLHTATTLPTVHTYRFIYLFIYFYKKYLPEILVKWDDALILASSTQGNGHASL